MRIWYPHPLGTGMRPRTLAKVQSMLFLGRSTGRSREGEPLAIHRVRCSAVCTELTRSREEKQE